MAGVVWAGPSKAMGTRLSGGLGVQSPTRCVQIAEYRVKEEYSGALRFNVCLVGFFIWLRSLLSSFLLLFGVKMSVLACPTIVFRKHIPCLISQAHC